LFSIDSFPLNRDKLHSDLANDKAGAIVVFEGWVRDHNEGKKVKSLEYQVYTELALKEGNQILKEASEKFNLHGISCVHREGHLSLGDIAIWIGATASHRDDAFKATRFVIDEIKHRLPVWKKEHYVDEKPEWVFCRHHHHHVHFDEADYYKKQAKLVEQTKLKASKVLVIGAGGLGCPVLVNLASAGIGHLTIVDPDKISISNIHRQFLFAPNLVGESKALVAKNRLLELNPFITVTALTEYFHPHHILGFDLVLDCTDNMTTKFLIHDACLKNKIPMISAGVYKFEGNLRTFIPGKGCLRCFGNVTPNDGLLGNCNDFGVLGATTSILGSMQASEAIAYLLTGENESSKYTFLFDLKLLSPVKVKNNAHPDCLTCAGLIDVESSDLEVDEIGDSLFVDIRQMSDHELAHFNTDKRVVLCCHRGHRSKKIADQFRAKGIEAYSLRGGAENLS
jgi:sulfur-carrier protein adenylyltransferase/sulfurtransferase